nr:cyclase family protein [Candidatus Freyrarchaeum guaymaensis]
MFHSLGGIVCLHLRSSPHTLGFGSLTDVWAGKWLPPPIRHGTALRLKHELLPAVTPRNYGWPPLRGGIMNARFKVFDLSHVIEEGMPVYPGDVPPEISAVTSVKEKGYRISRLVLGSHTGTHVDAPAHFIESGEGIDQVSLNRLVGWAFVADLSYVEVGKGIEREDLEHYDRDVREGDILLVYTGMENLWGQEEFLTNYTHLTLSAAEWILEKKVKAVGFDWMSVERYGGSGEVHRRLLSEGVMIIESLTGLGAIRGERVFFVLAPLKVKGCDGGPARAIAVKFEG